MTTSCTITDPYVRSVATVSFAPTRRTSISASMTPRMPLPSRLNDASQPMRGSSHTSTSLVANSAMPIRKGVSRTPQPCSSITIAAMTACTSEPSPNFRTKKEGMTASSAAMQDDRQRPPPPRLRKHSGASVKT